MDGPDSVKRFRYLGVRLPLVGTGFVAEDDALALERELSGVVDIPVEDYLIVGFAHVDIGVTRRTSLDGIAPVGPRRPM
ncbi:hypothetical protein BM92_00400 [Haloferax mediterranei ATCC 33500]|nr:hypothetical protein BM92_00400 [Haloferax mediterranei ATCC 33500]